LIEVADRHPSIDVDLAGVRRLLPDDHAKDRRLAGTVRPDEADPFSTEYGEARVDE
jgi:hypothetical protein